MMKAEKLLSRAGVPYSLIPTPREISSECGMSVELPSGQLETACEVLGAHGLQPAGVHWLPLSKPGEEHHEKND